MRSSGGRDGEGTWPLRAWPIPGRGAGAAPQGTSASSPSLFDAVRPGRSPQSAISVTDLVAITRSTLEGAVRPQWVRGEVTGFKTPRSGHWYFTLRDRTAQIRCVVWSGDQRGIPAPPDEGMEVLAFGQITVYPARGEMHLRVTSLEARGDGLHRLAVERTLASLRKDGLLAQERKRDLPRYPRCVAVITSLDGAALHDIIAVTRRRAPSMRIVVVAARVQGDEAADDLCAAFDRLHRWGKADVVIVGRGGGAKEDLHVFNNERVARALAACRVPTVSAIGHEIDTTVCDLVADRRAPTPSAAAEAAVPFMASEDVRVRELATRIVRVVRRRLQHGSQQLARATTMTRRTAVHVAARRRSQLSSLAARIQALSPVAVLARGYAIPRRSDGHTLTGAAEFRTGDEFELIVRDGIIGAVISTVRPTAWPVDLVEETVDEPREERQ